MANQHLDFTSKVEEGCLKDKETENQRGEQHNEALLLANPWKPWQRSRSLVKGQIKVKRLYRASLPCPAHSVLPYYMSFLRPVFLHESYKQWLSLPAPGYRILAEVPMLLCSGVSREPGVGEAWPGPAGGNGVVLLRCSGSPGIFPQFPHGS